MLKGLQKLTLLDFPGRIAATVFFGGCNFRCPFCHNASLVLGERLCESANLKEEEFFSFLDKRRGILEGVCVSGGEPTLFPGIADFIGEIKKRGFLVKLDTNGYEPGVLKELCSLGIIDYVAMDIKNSPKKYAETTGVPSLDFEKIRKSAEFLMTGDVDFEFRTTLVRSLHDEEDIREISEWLCGEEKFFLQTFINSGDLISDGFDSYDKKETEALLKVLKMRIPNAQIRG